jgi:hypothetical protein
VQDPQAGHGTQCGLAAAVHGAGASKVAVAQGLDLDVGLEGPAPRRLGERNACAEPGLMRRRRRLGMP